MLRVKNGSRIFQFEGRLLGSSTSWRHGASRWIEFNLYKTDEEEQYVISRVGVSLFYHIPDCEVVSRNDLHEVARADVNENSVPCDICKPHMSNLPIVCPERPRYWAQVCDTPDGVVEALMKFDVSGNKYLTFVAQRLLEEAAHDDRQLADSYFVETIR